jgi:hypothetical protein
VWLWKGVVRGARDGKPAIEPVPEGNIGLIEDVEGGRFTWCERGQGVGEGCEEGSV